MSNNHIAYSSQVLLKESGSYLRNKSGNGAAAKHSTACKSAFKCSRECPGQQGWASEHLRRNAMRGQPRQGKANQIELEVQDMAGRQKIMQ
jgi:hypothetical protein